MLPQEKIQQQIQKLLELLGVRGTVAIEDREGELVFNIKSEDSSLLIGQYGATLFALQYLARLLVKRSFLPQEEPSQFTIDVENYRKDREEFLAELARQAAMRVRETKQRLVLKPMSSYERFVIHSHLSQNTDLITESIGEEPERRVVIRPKD
ncbi:MAG: KH domain-containing protein [Candidatus Doudnabacteria bacterium]|nr:KH domain-containing protein [Candidatus Doudnabacteria bacterium]